jgi:hypothetical protein
MASCETVKSRTHLSSFATKIDLIAIICPLQHAFVLVDLLWVYHRNHSKVGTYVSHEFLHSWISTLSCLVMIQQLSRNAVRWHAYW